MKCEIVEALIPAYIDKSCSEEVRKMIDEHLLDCPNCRALLKEFELVEQCQIQTPSEKSVFKKVKNKYRNHLLLAIGITGLITLLFGNQVLGQFMKLKFQLYLNHYFPENNYMISHLEYYDFFNDEKNYYKAQVFNEENELELQIICHGLFSPIQIK